MAEPNELVSFETDPALAFQSFVEQNYPAEPISDDDLDSLGACVATALENLDLPAEDVEMDVDVVRKIILALNGVMDPVLWKKWIEPLSKVFTLGGEEDDVHIRNIVSCSSRYGIRDFDLEGIDGQHTMLWNVEHGGAMENLWYVLGIMRSELGGYIRKNKPEEYREYLLTTI